MIINKKDLDVLKCLLADSRLTTPQLSRALVVACHSSDEQLSAMQLLQDRRVDPNWDDGDALIGACLNENVEVVTQLLERGADPSVRNNACIKLACASGNKDLVCALLEDDRVNVCDSGNFAARHAWSNNIVKLLIVQEKIDVHELDKEGKSLLHHACAQGNWDVAKLLVHENKLDPFTRDIYNRTSVDYAFAGDQGDAFDMIVFLVESVYWSRLRWVWMKIYEDFELCNGVWEARARTATGEFPRLNVDICHLVGYWLHQVIWSEGATLVSGNQKKDSGRESDEDSEESSSGM